MTRSPRPSPVRVLAAAALLAAALPVGLAGGDTAAPHELLPDLNQLSPLEVVVREDGGRSFVGFDSAVENLGDGPLVVEASRPDRRSPMRAHQVVALSGRGERRLDHSAGILRYRVSPDHQHWHLLDFDRYTLRRVGSRRVRVIRKTGFCLTDDYRAPAIRHVAPEHPLTQDDTDCGRGRPEALSISQGISRGWGDEYVPYLEGQEIEVTRLRAGRYVLAQEVNPGRRLRETDYRNNTASALLELRRSRGRVKVRVLARCGQGATCLRRR